MPWKSKAQMRAAYGGHLGSEMKAKAPGWSAETPNIKRLPAHAAKKAVRRKALLSRMKGSPHA